MGNACQHRYPLRQTVRRRQRDDGTVEGPYEEALPSKAANVKLIQTASGSGDENSIPAAQGPTSHELDFKEPSSHPTAKEIAAANAARVRLGYKATSASDCAAMEVQAKLPDGPEPRKVQNVEYTLFKDVAICSDPQTVLAGLREHLSSNDWYEQCQALASAQQLAVHHASLLDGHLYVPKESVVQALVKIIRSPRSQPCKVATYILGDFFRVYGDKLLPYVDGQGMGKPLGSALCQLLLKAGSKEKKFVLEAAQQTLKACCFHLEPAALIHLLLPYAKHKNPGVRGGCAECLSSCVMRLVQVASAKHFIAICMGGLLPVIVLLSCDNTPAARLHSREMLRTVKKSMCQWDEDDLSSALDAFKGTTKGEEDVDKCSGQITAWDAMCKHALTAHELVAVQKLT